MVWALSYRTFFIFSAIFDCTFDYSSTINTYMTSLVVVGG